MSNHERDEVDPYCPYGPTGCERYRKADEERGVLAEFVNAEVMHAAEALERGPLPCGCVSHDRDDRYGIVRCPTTGESL